MDLCSLTRSSSVGVLPEGSPSTNEPKRRRANGALVGLRTDGARNTITESRHPRAAAFGLIAFSP
jgi:hypothetical protein